MDYKSALADALGHVLSPDTNAVKAATAKLNNELYKRAESIPALFELGVQSGDVGPRQLAFVELRKRVNAKNGKVWRAQSDTVRAVIKEQILLLVTSEADKAVRSAETRVIASIAGPELKANSWEAFVPWLWALLSDVNDKNREIGHGVLYTVLPQLLEVPGSSTREIVQRVMEKIAAALSDAVLAVRVLAVRSIGRLLELEMIEPETAPLFEQALSGIVHVLQAVLQSNDETGVKIIVEVLDSYTFDENGLVEPHMNELVEFLLTAASNVSYDEDQRVMLLNALFWVLRIKKNKIVQHGLVPKLIHALLPIGAEEEPEDTDEDAPARAAFRLLDTLATHLSPQQIFPVLFPLISQHVQDASHPGLRKSAVTALGVVVDGCAVYIQPHFEEIWPIVTVTLKDPEPVVRCAACTTLGLLCESLSDECASKHEELLPLLAQLLTDEPTQRAAAIALDCLLETLGESINPYLDQLVPSLLMMLQSVPQSVQTLVVGCISSAAHAGKARFVPYFAQTMAQMKPFLFLTEDGDPIELRTVTQDAIATIAEAVGPQHFAPHLADTMQCVLDGLSKASSLKESAYLFFAVMARVFKRDFAPYLPQIMEPIAATLAEPDIDFGSNQGTSQAIENLVSQSAETGEIDQEALDDLLEDDDDEFDDAILQASSAVASEKEYASDALAELFAHIRDLFMPYFLTSLDALRNGLKSKWHAGLRKSSASAMLGFVSTLYQMSNSQWTQGLTSPALDGDLATVADAVVKALFEAWDDEDDISVVKDFCTSLSAALITVGPRLLNESQYHDVCQKTLDILNGRALCQTIDLDDGFDDPDAEQADQQDQSEFASTLNAAAMELAGSLATVLGADFNRVIPIFLPVILGFYRPEKSANDRAAAIGTFAEIANSMGEAITPFAEQLFPLFLSALSDSDIEVRSNAAFGIGCLILSSSLDMTSQYPTVLTHLHAIIQSVKTDATPATLARFEGSADNALGAIARILIKSPSINIDSVSDLFVQNVPLRRDFAESERVVDALLGLFQRNDPAVLTHIDHLLASFQSMLASTDAGFYPDAPGAQLKAESRQKVVEIVRVVNGAEPSKVQAAGLVRFLN